MYSKMAKFGCISSRAFGLNLSAIIPMLPQARVVSWVIVGPVFLRPLNPGAIQVFVASQYPAFQPLKHLLFGREFDLPTGASATPRTSQSSVSPIFIWNHSSRYRMHYPVQSQDETPSGAPARIRTDGKARAGVRLSVRSRVSHDHPFFASPGQHLPGYIDMECRNADGEDDCIRLVAGIQDYSGQSYG
ncbi:hypothetical protein VTI74DRAFT_2495 [Chaetomium olivicolor]